MATLGTVPAPGTELRLEQPLDAWSRPRGQGRATQVWAGRHLRVLEADPGGGPRLRVRLWEDGYPCWIEAKALQAAAVAAVPPPLPRLGRAAIAARLPVVLAFAQAAAREANVYLWGGSLG
ncbi:MAG: NlpC/P60 family protein, partial [Cyanobium sp.]